LKNLPSKGVCFHHNSACPRADLTEYTEQLWVGLLFSLWSWFVSLWFTTVYDVNTSKSRNSSWTRRWKVNHWVVLTSLYLEIGI
jgi:hypothetical protein